MKAVIWIGCFILHYIFTRIIDTTMANFQPSTDQEIILFATLKGLFVACSFGFLWWLARKFCKLWDKHKKKKKDEQTQSDTAVDSEGEKTVKYQERPNAKASLNFYLKSETMEEQKEQPKQEEISETHNEVSRENTENPPSREVFSLPFSKRIAAIISLILCAVLYLSFLSAFSTKRDTYICYTTKTGECYHSAICQVINKKESYETTVYESCQKYKRCVVCNPCIERYETTITDRNYVIPILISVPISATVFLLLTYRKKN